MAAEPREPERPAAEPERLPAASHLLPDPGAPSPWRALFAIVPAIVIVVVASNLIGMWGASHRDSAQDTRRGDQEQGLSEDANLPRATEDAAPPVDAAARPRNPATDDRTAPSDAGDTGLVLRLIADADPEDGSRVFRMCMPCHTAEKGAGHKIGPNLWGVVGRDKTREGAFVYSAALQAKGGAWTYAELVAFLRNPRAFAPGTSMAFAGLSDPKRLADLLAYMRTLSDAPTPLP